MRVLSSVACLALHYSSTLSNKRYHIPEKKWLNIKSLFWFSFQLFFWNISHSEKNSWRYCRKYTQVLILMCQVLTKLGFTRQICEKLSNIRCQGNISCGSRGVSCGWTDGQGDRQTDRQKDWHMTKLTIAFCNCANAPTNAYFSNVSFSETLTFFCFAP